MVPCMVDEVCLSALLNSAGSKLESVLLSSCSVQDHVLQPFLQCPNLHTLRCENVLELTGSAFARIKIRAPLKPSEISDCDQFTWERLRGIFDLSSIEHVILDRLNGKNLHLRSFVKNELPLSRLTRTLECISFQHSDITTEDVFIILSSMPSPTDLILYDLRPDWLIDEPYEELIEDAKIEEFHLLFPKVCISFNEDVMQ